MAAIKIEKGMSLPESGFFENLVQYNNLAAQGFSAWAFYPGMLFNAREKWWGNGGRRTSPHEGIDLGLYRDESGTIHRLDKNAVVPAIFKGSVRNIIDDYLGSTLFVAHDMYDSRENQCYTIYGHVLPAPGIAPGAAVSEGEIVAAIAGTEGGEIQITPHLHISIAWIPDDFPADQLTWANMHPRHCLVLMDPLAVLRCSCSMVEQKL